MFETLLNKVVVLKANIFVKKRLQHRCFPRNIARFLITDFLKSICERLLLVLLQILQNSQEKAPVLEVSFHQSLAHCFFQNKTPTQVFSCELCETFKTFCFTAQLRTTASVFMERILESILGIIYGTSKNLNLVNQCGFSRIKS